MTTLRNQATGRNLWTVLIVVAVFALALLFGLRTSMNWLIFILGIVGAAVLLLQPMLGLLAMPVVALIVRQSFGTGTQVQLNSAALLVPVMLGVLLLDLVVRKNSHLVRSRTFLPLGLFLLAALLSLLIGNATWDPFVPRNTNFIWVQLGQWTIFSLSAGAYFLTAQLVREERWLRRLTWTFLILGGGLAILRVLPFDVSLFQDIATVGLNRAPFWMLLAAISGGLLLFDGEQSRGQRIYLLGILVVVLYFSFVIARKSSSTWVGVSAALAVLVWLRWPRFRWVIVVSIVLLLAAGILFPAVYNFAGGEADWERTGLGRVVLIERVVEVSMRNPITGLGLASYRVYAATRPLGIWDVPQVSSHNNYVDLFSQVGLVGMAIFTWFVIEVARLGNDLRGRYSRSFASGYVHSMLATLASALVLMLFADWILPFVYNIGFPGFQASVLVWLFLGGLVALDQMGPEPE